MNRDTQRMYDSSLIANKNFNLNRRDEKKKDTRLKILSSSSFLSISLINSLKFVSFKEFKYLKLT